MLPKGEINFPLQKKVWLSKRYSVITNLSELHPKFKKRAQKLTFQCNYKFLNYCTLNNTKLIGQGSLAVKDTDSNSSRIALDDPGSNPPQY